MKTKLMDLWYYIVEYKDGSYIKLNNFSITKLNRNGKITMYMEYRLLGGLIDKYPTIFNEIRSN